MTVEQIQNSIPDVESLVRVMLSDLESAGSCDSKADFCENLRSAIIKATIVNQQLTSLLKKAEKCARYS